MKSTSLFFFGHVVIQWNPLCRQFLGCKVLVNGPKVGIAIIQICRLCRGGGIPCHQHACVRLVQLKFRGLRATFQWRFRFGHAIGFQCHASVRQPYEIFLIAGIPCVFANRGHGETAIAFRQLCWQLLEHFSHLQCAGASVLGNIMSILTIQIRLDTSYGRQIAIGVQKSVHCVRHTAYNKISAEIAHHRIMHGFINGAFVFATLTYGFQCCFTYADRPTKFFKIHRAHSSFRHISYRI